MSKRKAVSPVVVVAKLWEYVERVPVPLEIDSLFV